jgi:hypothetical protein
VVLLIIQPLFFLYNVISLYPAASIFNVFYERMGLDLAVILFGCWVGIQLLRLAPGAGILALWYLLTYVAAPFAYFAIASGESNYVIESIVPNPFWVIGRRVLFCGFWIGVLVGSKKFGENFPSVVTPTKFQLYGRYKK